MNREAEQTVMRYLSGRITHLRDQTGQLASFKAGRIEECLRMQRHIRNLDNPDIVFSQQPIGEYIPDEEAMPEDYSVTP